MTYQRKNSKPKIQFNLQKQVTKDRSSFGLWFVLKKLTYSKPHLLMTPFSVPILTANSKKRTFNP
ncbi:hypothetical protein DTO10_06715 [Peribacillus butanolivorans]|uniref:Uncharacterized protein n=1 Tax=Peribacillus butanolivorans TaxID=421767 RepID=A0ABM6XIM6_9BACI|nr:hypothetical protein DTO10_06715 [Peribacillus butanolivorans]